MTPKLLPVVVALALLVSVGCSCQQSGYRQVSSPDERYILVERELNCSALDPYRVTVSIQSRAPRLGFSRLGFPSKEVFAADASLRDTQIKWLDNHNIEVICTGCEKYGVAERVAGWRDINVKFDVGKAGKGVF
jgi:hypothetical protein